MLKINSVIDDPMNSFQQMKYLKDRYQNFAQIIKINDKIIFMQDQNHIVILDP